MKDSHRDVVRGKQTYRERKSFLEEEATAQELLEFLKETPINDDSRQIQE